MTDAPETLSTTTVEAPAVAPEPPKPIVTKDKWTIMTLLTFSQIPCDVKRVKITDGPWVLMFTFPHTSLELYERYMRGEKLPVEDIRDVERADRLFKGYLHRLSVPA